MDWLEALPAAEMHDGAPPAAAPAAAAAAAPAPAPAAAAAAVAAGSPWRAGQAVRHPRYGAGVVVGVAADTVDCDFGKLGRRSFPVRLCPLVAAAAEAAP